MAGHTKVIVTLNGKTVEASKGQTVLQVADARGIEIPTLCHMEGITPYGSCRLCTVMAGTADGKWHKLVTACNYPVWDGLVVETDTREVLAIRRLVVEALLGRCPSVPLLQDLASCLGVEARRFPVKDPNERCILCGLCVRVCDEVVGARALAFLDRGQARCVGTPFLKHPESCIGCGACAHVCPTRCISMEETAVRLLKERWGATRPCRYNLMGLLPGALCANDYECSRCETDQTFVDLCRPVHPVFVARNLPTEAVRQVVRRISMMMGTNGPARKAAPDAAHGKGAERSDP